MNRETVLAWKQISTIWMPSYFRFPALCLLLFKIQSKHFQRYWIFQGYFSILFFKYCVSVYSRPQWRACKSNLSSVHKDLGLVIHFICQKWKIWIKQCKYRLRNWTFTWFKLPFICCMKEHWGIQYTATFLFCFHTSKHFSSYIACVF